MSEQAELTKEDIIGANVILNNLKTREDNFLDLKNRFRDMLSELTAHLDTLRNIPQKSKAMAKEVLTEEIPSIAKEIKSAFAADNESITAPLIEASKDFRRNADLVSAKLTEASDNFKDELTQMVDEADEQVKSTTESAQKQLSALTETVESDIKKIVDQATHTLSAEIDQAKNNLQEMKHALQHVLSQSEADQQRINRHQWQWMLTAFVSSITTGLLVAWLRTYW